MSRRDRERERRKVSIYGWKFSAVILAILLVLVLTSDVGSWTNISKVMFFCSALFFLFMFVGCLLYFWNDNRVLSLRERNRERITEQTKNSELRLARRWLKPRRDKKGNIVNRPVWSSRKNERYFKRKKR